MQFDDLYQKLMEAPTTAPAPIRTPAPVRVPTPSRPSQPNRPSWIPKPDTKTKPKALDIPQEDEEGTDDDIINHDLKVAKKRKIKNNIFER